AAAGVQSVWARLIPCELRMSRAQQSHLAIPTVWVWEITTAPPGVWGLTAWAWRPAWPWPWRLASDDVALIAAAPDRAVVNDSGAPLQWPEGGSWWHRGNSCSQVERGENRASLDPK